MKSKKVALRAVGLQAGGQRTVLRSRRRGRHPHRKKDGLNQPGEFEGRLPVNVEIPPYVIELSDSRADPNRILDISASNVLCIDA